MRAWLWRRLAYYAAWVLLWSSLGGTTDELSCSAASDGYSELENDAGTLPVQLIGQVLRDAVFAGLACVDILAFSRRAQAGG